MFQFQGCSVRDVKQRKNESSTMALAPSERTLEMSKTSRRNASLPDGVCLMSFDVYALSIASSSSSLEAKASSSGALAGDAFAGVDGILIGVFLL